MLEKINTVEQSDGNSNLNTAEDQALLGSLPFRITGSATEFAHEYVRIHYNFNTRNLSHALLFAKMQLNSIVTTRFSNTPSGQELLIEPPLNSSTDRNPIQTEPQEMRIA